MGRDVVHVGGVGSGARLKLINNFLSGSQVAGLAEALSLIERSGLDVEKSLGVLTEGAPGSPLVKLLSGRMVSKQYEPNFLLRLMAKDLRYAVAEAEAQALAIADNMLELTGIVGHLLLRSDGALVFTAGATATA